MPNIDQVQLPDGNQYNLKDNISGYVTAGYVDDAISRLTKANVGLGNVDNTSDLNKPVSTAQQTALNGKTDTTVIAPTEATTTASRRYEIGEQFILNGVLYTATAVIASGDTIIVNTNCALSESITEQIANVDLSALANKSDLTDIFESGTTASQAISAGTYFYLNGTLVRAKTAIASGATFTENTNYEVASDGALNEIKATTDGILSTIHSVAITTTNQPIGYDGLLVVALSITNGAWEGITVYINDIIVAGLGWGKSGNTTACPGISSRALINVRSSDVIRAAGISSYASASGSLYEKL